ncbi:hypothetical protein ACP70R_004537 [Stipagrostis hirtigluma subsp. patula]
MTSPDQPTAKRLDVPPLLGLADDLIGEIFLRLPTLEDVGRAATACPTFRRVIAGHAFLRRLRSVHPARLLGFLYGPDFHPAEPPHPSAPYARALARAADFSFAFVPFPSAGPWFLRDVRDGRVLFENSMVAGELAVANPVFRRYALLPAAPIPDDMAAPVLEQSRLHLESFLVPAGEEEEDPASFRVICIAVSRARLIAFVFSSADGGWCAFPCQDWSNVAMNTGADLDFQLSWRYMVGGCLYWRVAWTNWLLVLDMRCMEFSFSEIPTDSLLTYCSAVAAPEDGRPELFSIRDNALYSTKQSDTGGANEWQSMEKVPVKLPWDYGFIVAGATEKYLLLQGSGTSCGSYPPRVPMEYFSLELKTMQLQKVCGLRSRYLNVNLYTGLPPSLSLPGL